MATALQGAELRRAVQELRRAKESYSTAPSLRLPLPVSLLYTHPLPPSQESYSTARSATGAAAPPAPA